jgi:hypothetical protein
VTQQQTCTTVQKLNHKQVRPCVIDYLPVTHESRSPWFLGHCSRQMRKSNAGANMVCSWAERVFVLEHCFASKLFAAVREAFRNAYHDKEVPNKATIHRLVTKFRDTGSVRLWHVLLIERKNSWNRCRTDFRQCISWNNGIRQKEFNTAIGFVVLRMKGSMWIVNGTLCIWVSLFNCCFLNCVSYVA